MKQLNLVAIKGSNRPAVPDATLVRQSDPQERIRITIYARRNPAPKAEILERTNAMSTQLPGERKYLSKEEFDNVYGADPNDLNKIEAWATRNNLKIESKNASQKQVKVEGTVQDINNALGLQLNEYDHPTLGHYRGRVGSITVPAEMQGIIEGVFGLDNRPIGHSRRRKSNKAAVAWQNFKNSLPKGTDAASASSSAFPGAFFPPAVAQLYSYPSTATGAGQNVAIFSFNGPNGGDPHGGYKLSAVKNYFEGTLGQTTPKITDVVIQGPGNDPGADTDTSGSNGDATGEVMLDLCVVGSMVPGAHIFMYFTEFSSQGWVNALHDAIAGTNDISVISISYGNPENDPNSAWSSMGVSVVNQAFEAAQARGITICCASGDDGSSDAGPGTKAEVDFPASSPFVLGVGGTKLKAGKTDKSSISSETVWNEMLKKEGAGGGGVSTIFSLPDYQDNADVPASVIPPHHIGRGVPDVAAVGDPETGVIIMNIDGQNLQQIGGTSASTPIWASLVARLNEALNARCGFLNTLLYTKFESGVLNDIVKGNNGKYKAKKGWDACTGLGTPNGERLLIGLSGNPLPAVKTETTTAATGSAS